VLFAWILCESVYNYEFFCVSMCVCKYVRVCGRLCNVCVWCLFVRVSVCGVYVFVIDYVCG